MWSFFWKERDSGRRPLNPISSSDTPTPPVRNGNSTGRAHVEQRPTVSPPLDSTTSDARHADETFAREDLLPRFNLDALDEPNDRVDMTNSVSSIRSHLIDSFSSAQPVTNRSQLIGRLPEIEQLISAVSEKRAHALVFGARGYGKTSLVRIFGQIADEARYLVVYLSCGDVDDFAALMRPYLTFVPIQYSAQAHESRAWSETNTRDTLADLLPANSFTASQLANVLQTIEGARLVFILDEYDRVVDLAVQREIANLIKDLSDLLARVHLILVGVASNVQELLGFHPSINRNLVCVPISRLKTADARRLIETGVTECGLSIDARVKEAIVSIAHGSPYHLRLMCLHSGLATLRSGSKNIDDRAFQRGLKDALADWTKIDRECAELIQLIEADSFVLAASTAIARANLRRGDSFTISQATPELAKLLGTQNITATSLRLGRFCKDLAYKGGILRSESSDTGDLGSIVYSFKNNLTAPFLLMASYLSTKSRLGPG